ncbi:MAG TPA: DMT family transporter [Cytophagaceae bacterium]|jgi:drug/metabolite transporter (DMT)-like permease|nr:DMT family transporter [Cytophagaceae bacterium]
MKESFKAHLMLSMAALIGGFNFTISKIIMPGFLKPMSLVIIRGIISILVFSLLHFLFVKEKLQKKDYGRVFLASLFGIVINQITFYEGLNLTSPINASLMMTITPIMVLVVSSLSGKEKMSVTKILGVFLGTAGTILLLLHSNRGPIRGLFAGDILVLINAVSWACFLVTVKPLMQEYNPLTILKWIFFLGFFLNLPFGYHDFATTNWNLMNAKELWAFAFIICFATLMAYYLNAAVLKYVNPSIAGSYIYLQPLLAGIIAIVWGKDSFNLEKLGYLTIILAGVSLVNFRNKKN